MSLKYADFDSHPSTHHFYEELCATAAIGELGVGEYTLLEEHLVSCQQCQAVYRDFCRISAADLSHLAIVASSAGKHGDVEFNEAKLLKGCFERASSMGVQFHLPQVRREKHISALSAPRWLFAGSFSIQRWVAVASVALVVSFIVWGYVRRDHNAKAQSATLLLHKLEELSSTSQGLALNLDTSKAELSKLSSERQQLQQQLVEARQNYAELTGKVSTLEKALAASNDQASGLQSILNASEIQHGQDQRAGELLQAELTRTKEELGQQQELVDNLRGKLQRPEVVPHSPVSDPTSDIAQITDGEAKQILAARDLHIVDVYDIDSNGKTRRTYGRVYYVEKKLLVFYAFDLADRKRNRVPAGFQAWGYQQATPGTSHSLGLFHVDDPGTNRWVLKVASPQVLEHVDALFVTLEPPEGSSSPRGRRLLYANLGNPPNHP